MTTETKPRRGLFAGFRRNKPATESRAFGSSQLWPPVVNPPTLETWVRDAPTAKGLSGIARGLSIYSGLIGQLALDQVRIGSDQVVTPRPRILNQPDLSKDLPTFIADSIEEYILQGNTLCLITARDFDGRPAAVKWFPVWQWDAPLYEDGYYLNGVRVDARDVIHVRRGSDPSNPRRGIGIVEQNLKTLERASLQESYESNTFKESGVPSVAVIAPQKDLSGDEIQAAADAWYQKFGGPVRRPGIFPNGTTIQPLSWSPEDSQLVLARQLTIVDLANVLNLDGYWLGATGSSHTYRSASDLYDPLLRISLEPVMVVFEAVWGQFLVPYGSTVRFGRRPLTRQTFADAVNTGAAAVNAGLMTVDEWRVPNGLPALNLPETTTLRAPSAAPPPALEPVTDEPKDPEEGPTK